MFQPLIFRGVPTFTHQVETFCEIESVSEVLPWTFAVTVEAVDCFIWTKNAQNLHLVLTNKVLVLVEWILSKLSADFGLIYSF